MFGEMRTIFWVLTFEKRVRALWT